MMEYKTLLIKIAIGGLTNDKTNEKIDFFHDVQIFIEVRCYFPIVAISPQPN